MNLTFETEQEDDGRWIAEVPELPGVLAYGATQQQAIIKAEALALWFLAERIAEKSCSNFYQFASHIRDRVDETKLLI
jgi:predicted RNase H-like HicB family nuclease